MDFVDLSSDTNEKQEILNLCSYNSKSKTFAVFNNFKVNFLEEWEDTASRTLLRFVYIERFITKKYMLSYSLVLRTSRVISSRSAVFKFV